MIILDSDVLIEILDKRSKRGEEAADRLRETGEEIATTSLNLHEVLYGFEKASKKTRALDAIPVLGYDRG
ncbi:MAG: PIN domain-containing protein, partial [Candidatus Bathyarchaeia archaeon]